MTLERVADMTGIRSKALLVQALMGDLVKLEVRPGPAQRRPHREELRDQGLLAVWQYINAPKALLEVIGANVVIPRHDDDAVAVTSYETVREPAQEIQRFLILLTQSLLGVRRIGLDALNDVPADEDQVGGSHCRCFFSGVVPPIVFKGIQKNVVTDRILRITMQVGDMEHA